MKNRILIVEDDELNMKLFNDLLQAHGFNTLKSVNGVDTISLAREHSPDLIIMDIRLPKMSGIEYIKTLKADNDLKNIPILAVSALAMKGDKERILEAGCDGYVSKPIQIRNFLDEVNKFLTLAHFRLTASLITGHPQVDAEHEELVALLNQICDLQKVGDDDGCSLKINEMNKAIKNHMENEENILVGLGYRQLDAHKKHHLETIREYDALIANAKNKEYGNDFTRALASILMDDMISADKNIQGYV